MRRKIAGGSDARRNVRGSDAGAFAPGGNKARFSLSADEHYVEGQRSTVLQNRSIKSVGERFATLTREERRTSHW